MKRTISYDNLCMFKYCIYAFKKNNNLECLNLALKMIEDGNVAIRGVNKQMESLTKDDIKEGDNT